MFAWTRPRRCGVGQPVDEKEKQRAGAGTVRRLVLRTDRVWKVRLRNCVRERNIVRLDAVRTGAHIRALSSSTLRRSQRRVESIMLRFTHPAARAVSAAA